RDLAHIGDASTRTGRNETADDDVLLEAFEQVGLARDGGLGEDAGRLLEGRGRDEGTSLQRRLGDAKQDRNGLRGLLAIGNELFVELIEVDAVDLLFLEQAGLAGLGDLDLLQHLANDHLDVLVVDQHALQAIDLLDLVDEILGQLLDALDGKDVVRCRVAVQDILAPLDRIAFLQVERLALRDEVLDRLQALVVRLDDDATLVLVVAAEADRAIDFG